MDKMHPRVHPSLTSTECLELLCSLANKMRFPGSAAFILGKGGQTVRLFAYVSTDSFETTSISAISYERFFPLRKETIKLLLQVLIIPSISLHNWRPMDFRRERLERNIFQGCWFPLVIFISAVVKEKSPERALPDSLHSCTCVSEEYAFLSIW